MNRWWWQIWWQSVDTDINSDGDVMRNWLGRVSDDMVQQYLPAINTDTEQQSPQQEGRDIVAIQPHSREWVQLVHTCRDVHTYLPTYLRMYLCEREGS